MSKVSNHVIFREPTTSQLGGWADYFEELAADSPAPHFDSYHEHASRLRLHCNALQAADECKKMTPVYATEADTAKHIASLKLGKAADVFGLTGEHLRFASDLLNTAVTKIINNALKDAMLPDHFKQGAVVPCLKKGKSARLPDSYRRITVASTIGKIVEKDMLKHTKPRSKIEQSNMQFGFTENCSPTICSLLVTEAIAEARDTKSSLYISFLDSSKAFDVVDHTVLLNSLYDLNLGPHLWSLYKDMYRNVTSRVRLHGHLSRVINERRGIRQGGETSTEGFKSKDNKFLNKIQCHPASLRIGETPVGIPTVADDNCLLSDCHTNAQVQLLMAQHNSEKDRYTFSTTKSKVIYIPGKDSEPQMDLQFNSNNIGYTSGETHLGLVRTPSGSSTPAVLNRVSVGRRTAYQLMGAGLSGLNGVSPDISRNLIQVYVTPAMTYGLEALRLATSDIEEVERFYRSLLRMLQYLPSSTAIPAIYLLIGCAPAEAILHRKILTLFITVASRPGTPEHSILTRQLAIKDLNSHSWTTQVRLILQQYQLPPALQLMENTPKTAAWKRTTKTTITSFWEDKLKMQARQMKSLQHLNLDMCSVTAGHPVWQTGTDPRQVPMASVRAQILTGRYPLTGEKCSGKRQAESCPYCGEEEPESIQHFVLHCGLHSSTRKKYIQELEETSYKNITRMPDDCKLRVMIDPSHLTDDRRMAIELEKSARKNFFKMHSRRAEADGRGSMQAWATKRSGGRKQRGPTQLPPARGSPT